MASYILQCLFYLILAKNEIRCNPPFSPYGARISKSIFIAYGLFFAYTVTYTYVRKRVCTHVCARGRSRTVLANERKRKCTRMQINARKLIVTFDAWAISACKRVCVLCVRSKTFRMYYKPRLRDGNNRMYSTCTRFEVRPEYQAGTNFECTVPRANWERTQRVPDCTVTAVTLECCYLASTYSLRRTSLDASSEFSVAEE